MISLIAGIAALLYGGYKFVDIDYVVTGKINQSEIERWDFIAGAVAMLAGVTLVAAYVYGYNWQLMTFFLLISAATTIGYLGYMVIKKMKKYQ